MYRLKFIFIFLSAGLSFDSVRGQQIGNYVNNGSFENAYDCLNPAQLYKAKFWNSIDSVSAAGIYLRVCNSSVPYNGFGFQYPRTGDSHILTNFFCPPPTCASTFNRFYLKNRLKSNLIAGKKYCATYYVNISNNSTYGIDAFGIYFGDNTLDTITYCTIPITYLVPQIQNPTNNIIVDTLGWVAVTGTFVASGSEKYLVLGNFKADSAVNKSLTNPANLPGVATDLCIDDVTCVELNLPAYAGPDKSCIPGDSVFIGRQSDWAIDPGCIWYKLPNPIPIDTISGLWVKPSFTSTYVVRQVLDCSPLKWDTVVVFIDAVGLTDLQNYSDNIKLFPNPTETDLTVTFGIGSDINKIAIINSLGQTIREEDLRIRKTEFTVSTSELEKGIYLIQFRTSVGTLTKLFIKN